LHHISTAISIAKEFVGFTRPKIAICITSLAVSGYLLFNTAGVSLLFVTLCAFFATSAAYSYNLITDREEDVINHNKLNYFAVHCNTGKCIVIIFMVISTVSALFLSNASLAVYILATVTGVIYSRFRIKEIFPLKNIYTAGSLLTSFLVGAFNAPIGLNIILYSIPVAMFLFIASLISDLRDYPGDKSSGIRTLPVVLGYDAAQKIVYVMTVIFLLLVVYLKLAGLYLLLPFLVPLLLLLWLKKPDLAHLCAIYSIIFLPLGVLLYKLVI